MTKRCSLFFLICIVAAFSCDSDDISDNQSVPGDTIDGGAAIDSGGGDTVIDADVSVSSCDPACATDEFCDFEANDCGSGSGGTCTTRPDACADVFDPVCGCDNQTYPNACQANASGVDVASEGPCEASTCAENDQADPCVVCELAAAPKNKGQCQCPACPSYPMRQSECTANLEAYASVCTTPQPCPEIVCTEPPPVTCGPNNTCTIGVAPL